MSIAVCSRLAGAPSDLGAGGDGCGARRPVRVRLLSHTTCSCALGTSRRRDGAHRRSRGASRSTCPRLRGVRVHRSGRSTRTSDCRDRRRIATTPCPRTLIDLTAVRGLGMDRAGTRRRGATESHDPVASRVVVPIVCEVLPGRRPSVLRLLVAERFEVGGGKTEELARAGGVGRVARRRLPAARAAVPRGRRRPSVSSRLRVARSAGGARGRRLRPALGVRGVPRRPTPRPAPPARGCAGSVSARDRGDARSRDRCLGVRRVSSSR